MPRWPGAYRFILYAGCPGWRARLAAGGAQGLPGVAGCARQAGVGRGKGTPSEDSP